MTYDIRRLCRLSNDGEERSHWLNAFKTKYIRYALNYSNRTTTKINQYNSYN